MKSDYEKGVRKTIDLSVRTKEITSDILKACMKEFLENESECKGKIPLRKLQEKYSCKLENIEVSENNIRDFLNVAKKYDIDFSLKRDNTKEPPVYHVFFSASRTDDFKRAFTEYANSKQLSESKPERGEFSRDNLKKEAAEVSKQQKRDKIRQRSREVSH